jgi:hypothetical protein
MQKGDSVLSCSRKSGDRDSESSLHVHKLVERVLIVLDSSNASAAPFKSIPTARDSSS